MYPYGSEFFRFQLQATVFHRWMAFFRAGDAHASGVGGDGAGVAVSSRCSRFCGPRHSIARQLFKEARAQWAGVALVAAVFTLPVAGTALYMVDQHLHPRTMATALILLAVSWMMAGRRWQAAPLLVAAFVLHPIMATLGISFCFFLWMAQLDPVHEWVRQWVHRRADNWRASTGARS